MSKVTIVLLVVIAILLIAIVVLYFLGKKAEKKRAEQEEQIAAAAQTVSMLIIDKKKMKLIDSGLPANVIEQTPKMMRKTKMPIVKAKVGPKVMTFICDAGIFDSVPVKKEVKATVSGLYITSVKGIRGPIVVQDQEKKKGFRAKLQKKYNETYAELQKQKNDKDKKKK
ncbi:MAG: hypothetical protein J6A92_03225 [Lachnospiraceae bacterium]|nr:hypothetical protein [Lachnospiraceae bacterium]